MIRKIGTVTIWIGIDGFVKPVDDLPKRDRNANNGDFGDDQKCQGEADSPAKFPKISAQSPNRFPRILVESAVGLIVCSIVNHQCTEEVTLISLATHNRASQAGRDATLYQVFLWLCGPRFWLLGHIVSNDAKAKKRCKYSTVDDRRTQVGFHKQNIVNNAQYCDDIDQAMQLGPSFSA